VTSYVALLRGVNIGGRLLKMQDLTRIAVEIGLDSPRTYIASGNLMFASGKSEPALKRELEGALKAHFGKAVPVMVRTAKELGAVVSVNPFRDEPGNKVVAIFLDSPPPADAEAKAVHLSDERVALGEREIYVHYPSGIGGSKLRIPAAQAGTARNMNTVARLADLAMEAA
jgi:uncharacterized protein (DUF1697 family)